MKYHQFNQNNQLRTTTTLFLKKKLFVLGFATLLIISGCAPKENPVEKNPPVITLLDIRGNTIGILAEDDIGVVGYLVTTNNTTPDLNDSMWKEGPIFKVNESGTYYVWVKDTEGNISEPKEAVVEIDDPIARLAPDYDHLAWYLDDSPTKTVDGKTYDLNALRQQYGDLYRFVEPLSKEEVEQRFEYIVKYLVDGGQDATYASGFSESTVNEQFIIKISNSIDEYMENIDLSKDEKISKFGKYYGYSERLERYRLNPPESFDSDQTRFGLGIDSLTKVSFQDKDWYVREYATNIDLSLNLAKEMGVNLQFWFDTAIGN